MSIVSFDIKSIYGIGFCDLFELVKDLQRERAEKISFKI